MKLAPQLLPISDFLLVFTVDTGKINIPEEFFLQAVLRIQIRFRFYGVPGSG
jgi:hypothetical protein